MIDGVVKQGVNGIQNILVKNNIIQKMNEGKIKYNTILAQPFSNKIKLMTSNVLWASNDNNEITQYFDLNFLFTWKSTDNTYGQYLQGLNGVTTYTSVKADIFGGALHNNQWRGRRLFKE